MSRRQARSWIGLLVAMFFGSSEVPAANETLVMVSQVIPLRETALSNSDSISTARGNSPSLITAGSYVIRDVGYVLSEDRARSADMEVRLTVAPNAISTWTEPENAARGAFAVENRNAASLLPLRLSFPEGSPDSSGMRFPGLFGDTLVVVMDLSDALKTNETLASSDTFNEIVGKTAQCLLLNARRQWPRIKHLALSIDGSHAHEHLEGVHSLEEVVIPALPSVPHKQIILD